MQFLDLSIEEACALMIAQYHVHCKTFAEEVKNHSTTNSFNFRTGSKIVSTMKELQVRIVLLLCTDSASKDSGHRE